MWHTRARAAMAEQPPAKCSRRGRRGRAQPPAILRHSVEHGTGMAGEAQGEAGGVRQGRAVHFPTSSWARRGSALPRPVSLRLPLWCWREPSPSCGAAQSLVPCALYARHAQSHGLVAWEAELADWAGVTPNGHLYALLTFLAVGLATVESTSDSDDAEKLSRARGHAIPRARRRLRATAARRLLRGGGCARRLRGDGCAAAAPLAGPLMRAHLNLAAAVKKRPPLGAGAGNGDGNGKRPMRGK